MTMIDLHMHSKYSNDGEFTVHELVKKCAEQGITIMSITDHNCARANAEAIPAAAEKGIVYIPGIEIDCTYANTNFHMLGYGIDYLSPDFDDIEKSIRSQGLAVSLKMLEKTQALGFHVTEKEMWNLSKDSYWAETWTGEMFAEVLLSKPEYADNNLLMPYRAGRERGDNPYVNFYWDFYSQGKPCYAEVQYPQMEKIIDIIHQNNGFAVLAHPHVNLKGKTTLLEGIIHLGIDGMEAYSSYHSPSQSSNTAVKAKRHHLFTTCGSDFHGKTKPSISLGKHGCLITEEEMKMQIKRLVKSNFAKFLA